MLILAVGVPLALFVWRQNVLREQSQTENLPFLHSLGAAAMTGIDLIGCCLSLLNNAPSFGLPNWPE
jgi:hypothetical protein